MGKKSLELEFPKKINRLLKECKENVTKLDNEYKELREKEVTEKGVNFDNLGPVYVPHFQDLYSIIRESSISCTVKYTFNEQIV